MLKPLSSAVSIGSGGPFGAEGPIIMTGGAIGSLFAQLFDLSAAERKTLLVAGATAGMTGIFGTPLASIMLAVELLLFEWKPRSFVPVVTAVLVALAWRPLLVGAGPLFPFAAPTPAGMEPVAISAGIGLVTGLLAAFMSFLLYRIEDGFHALPIHWMWWPAIGAVVVGIGGLFDIRVLGAGYGSIQDLLDGNLVVKAVVMLLVVKAVVWLVALGSGTSGGILAPLLILGGCAGFLIGQYLPGDPGFWAMIGMAGVMSGTMRAPMTGRAVRRRAHQPLARASGDDRRGLGRLCDQRAGDEALDPDREDRPARAAHPPRIYGRCARVPAGGAADDPRSGDAARHMPLTEVRALLRRRGDPPLLSGGRFEPGGCSGLCRGPTHLSGKWDGRPRGGSPTHCPMLRRSAPIPRLPAARSPT